MTDRFKNSLKFSLTAFALCSTLNLSAQETTSEVTQNPPVNVGVMPGSCGVFFQLTLDKKLQSAPKMGFFGVTVFTTRNLLSV